MGVLPQESVDWECSGGEGCARPFRHTLGQSAPASPNELGASFCVFCASVFLAAMDLEIASASRTCTFLPSLSTHLTSAISPVVSKAEPLGKWNGLHSPISVKSKLNLSIEVPSPSQVYFYNYDKNAKVDLQ